MCVLVYIQWDWPANTVAGCMKRISPGVKQSGVNYLWHGKHSRLRGVEGVRIV